MINICDFKINTCVSSKLEEKISCTLKQQGKTSFGLTRLKKLKFTIKVKSKEQYSSYYILLFSILFEHLKML